MYTCIILYESLPPVGYTRIGADTRQIKLEKIIIDNTFCTYFQKVKTFFTGIMLRLNTLK